MFEDSRTPGAGHSGKWYSRLRSCPPVRSTPTRWSPILVTVTGQVAGSCHCNVRPGSVARPAGGPEEYSDQTRRDAMAIDLTGGLSDDREYVFATQPDNPEMRESVNVWVW